MIININYGNRVAVIPGSAIEHLSSATLNDMKALVAIASENGNDKSDIKSIADKINMDLGDFVVSLNFWQNAGVISMSESLHIRNEAPAEKPAEKHSGEGSAQKNHHRRRHHKPRPKTEG